MHRFNREEHRTLIAAAVREFASPIVSLENYPGNMELVVRRQADDRLLIHMINYTGPFPRPLEKLCPMRNFIVKIKTAHKSARTLFGGGKLKTESKNGLLSVSIPELREYEVVILESP